MAYTKLANSILTSTIWMESDHTRLVWLTMLAMADKNGEVQASIPGLANVARVPLESCVKAIEVFLSPDEYSRTKTDEGRRIEEIKGGWLLINFAEYRRLASDEDRKEKATERKRNQRERDARNSGVTCHKKSHQNSQADTDTDTKAEAEANTKAKRKTRAPGKFTIPTLEQVDSYCHERGNDVDPGNWMDHYTANGWLVGRNPMKDWKAAVRTWEKNGVNNGKVNAKQPKTFRQIEAEQTATQRERFLGTQQRLEAK